MTDTKTIPKILYAVFHSEDYYILDSEGNNQQDSMTDVQWASLSKTKTQMSFVLNKPISPDLFSQDDEEWYGFSMPHIILHDTLAWETVDTMVSSPFLQEKGLDGDDIKIIIPFSFHPVSWAGLPGYALCKANLEATSVYSRILSNSRKWLDSHPESLKILESICEEVNV